MKSWEHFKLDLVLHMICKNKGIIGKETTLQVKKNPSMKDSLMVMPLT